MLAAQPDWTLSTSRAAFSTNHHMRIGFFCLSLIFGLGRFASASSLLLNCLYTLYLHAPAIVKADNIHNFYGHEQSCIHGLFCCFLLCRIYNQLPKCPTSKEDHLKRKSELTCFPIILIPPCRAKQSPQQH